ncbi:MAG: tetratricopeptide repeat protein [Brevinematia bacterium]
MKKVILAMILSFIYLHAYPSIFKEVKNEADAKSMYEKYKNLFNNDKNNYEYAYKYCAFARFYGFYFLKEKSEREKVFEEAKNAGEVAVKLSPNSPEGHYFLGVAYGSWAEEKGVMNSLFLAEPIVDEMTKVIKIDPSFRNGSAYMVRGRVYQKAPGWPISIGDKQKAQEDFEKAITYTNRQAYRYYAEFLIDQNQKEKGLEIIEKGLSLPPGEEKIVDEYEIKMLSILRDKIKK